jgi:DnaK suppressor protein
MNAGTGNQELLDRSRVFLEQERARLTRMVSDLVEAERRLGESQGSGSDIGGEPAEIAADLVEQELSLSLEHLERERLRDVTAALERLVEGRYNVCERCGGVIAWARLRALPWAHTCLACASLAEGPRL